jgi:hypothetical protein
LLDCNLIRRQTMHLLLEEIPIPGTAQPEDLGRVNAGQVDSGCALQVGERLITSFAVKRTTVNVQCDCVHPAHDRSFVAKLMQPLPSL